jgi:hypothetical protein
MSNLPHVSDYVPRNPYAKLGWPTILLVLIAAISTRGFQPLAVDSTTLVADMLIALAAAAAVALLFERAVEVLLMILCGTQEMALETHRKAQAEVRSEAISVEPAVLDGLTSTEERMAFLEQGGSADRLARQAYLDPEAVNEWLNQELRLKTNKQYLSTLLLTLFGGAASICGFRLLSMIFGYRTLQGVSAHQMSAFGLLDVVLTTLVLGGGAVGIHKLIGRLQTKPEGG